MRLARPGLEQILDRVLEQHADEQCAGERHEQDAKQRNIPAPGAREIGDEEQDDAAGHQPIAQYMVERPGPVNWAMQPMMIAATASVKPETMISRSA